MRLRSVLVGAIGVTAGVLVALVTEGHTLDFGFDWLTARALVTGVDPYQPVDRLAGYFGATVGESAGVIHPRSPAVLLLQAPVGWIPMGYGYRVGRVLTVLSLVFLMWVVGRVSRVSVQWTIAAVPFLLFVFPFSDVLAFSQTSFLVAGLIGWTWLLADRKDTFTAGLPLAGAVAFKLWPWLIVPALWLAGYRKAAVGAFGGFAALNVAGLLLPHVSWTGAVDAMAGATTLDDTWSFVRTWPIGLTIACGLGAVVALSWWVRPRKLVMLSIPVALVFAPILWPHYLVVMAVPLAMWLRDFAVSSANATVEGTAVDGERAGPRRQAASLMGRNRGKRTQGGQGFGRMASRSSEDAKQVRRLLRPG